MPERLTLAIAEAAVELLHQNGDDGFSATMYSGRGMYGQQVPGITGPAGHMGDIAWAIIKVHIQNKTEEYFLNDEDSDPDEVPRWLYEEWLDEARSLIPSRYDSMGLYTIYY